MGKPQLPKCEYKYKCNYNCTYKITAYGTDKYKYMNTYVFPLVNNTLCTRVRVQQDYIQSGFQYTTLGTILLRQVCAGECGSVAVIPPSLAVGLDLLCTHIYDIYVY